MGKLLTWSCWKIARHGLDSAGFLIDEHTNLGAQVPR